MFVILNLLYVEDKISITFIKSNFARKTKIKIHNKVKVFLVIDFLNIVACVVCLPVIRERRTLSQTLQQVHVCHTQTSEQPRFMEKEAPCIKSKSSTEVSYTKSTITT